MRFDGLQQFDAVAELERDVHNDKVWQQGLDSLDRLGGIFGLPTDGQPRVLINQLRQAFAEDRMVVH